MKKILLNIIIIAFVISGASSRGDDGSEAFTRQLLKDAGVVVVEPENEDAYKFAEEIIKYLLPVHEMNKIVSPSARQGKYDIKLFDYGESGKFLTYQRALDLNVMSKHFSLGIDTEQSIRLRHRIEIGTDLASWETIRKETNWPVDNPFKRIYLHVQRRGEKGRMRGNIYYQGSMVTISIHGLVNEKTTHHKNLTK